MSAPTDGGPAFPVVFDHGDCKSEQEGMSLRDYFAGQAISAVVDDRARDGAIADPPSVARESYAIADAMLTARKLPPAT